MPSALPASFYQRGNVATIARQLLGKKLCTTIRGDGLTSGIITETEAYSGRNDKACHAHNGLRTKRTEVMYAPGGCAYIYLCYGIHHLFNVVTNTNNRADAVLIRAIKPIDGIPLMLARRSFDAAKPRLTAGPGRLSQALGLHTDMSGTSLLGNSMWIEPQKNTDGQMHANPKIIASPRIGVAYAEEHANRPWRFYLNEFERWVSQ